MSWRNPTEVRIAIEVSVLLGGQGIAGKRRGARIMGMSSVAQMNFRKGDSSSVTGML